AGRRENSTSPLRGSGLRQALADFPRPKQKNSAHAERPVTPYTTPPLPMGCNEPPNTRDCEPGRVALPKMCVRHAPGADEGKAGAVGENCLNPEERSDEVEFFHRPPGRGRPGKSGEAGPHDAHILGSATRPGGLKIQYGHQTSNHQPFAPSRSERIFSGSPSQAGLSGANRMRRYSSSVSSCSSFMLSPKPGI